MLVVIILLAAVVVGELGQRFLPGGPGTTTTPAPAAAAVPIAAAMLPAGSRIASVTVVGDRAVLLITLPGGGQELRSLDPGTGAAVTLLTTAP